MPTRLRPSLATTAAGPSQAASVPMARRTASCQWIISRGASGSSRQAAGSVRTSASRSGIPWLVSSSTMRSRSAESEPWCMSSPGSPSSASRFRTAERTALMLLISPLCPSTRKGWARYQLEKVLVE